MNILKIDKKAFIVFFVIIYIIFNFIIINVYWEESVSSPRARSGHGMVYDSDRNRTVLFGGMKGNGGTVLGDLWEFEFQSKIWTEIYTSGKPSPRFNFGMVYDSNHKQIIIFGGMLANYERTDEMWSYNTLLRTWTELTPLIRPSSRSDPGMVYNPENDMIILFGGYNFDDTHSGDTWVYFGANSTWREQNPVISPEPRYGHSMVYNPLNQTSFIFGGRVIGLTNDLWEYDYETDTWKECNPDEDPLVRYWHDMIFDTYNERMFVFGGDNEQYPDRALSDTWIYQLRENSWVENFPKNPPEARNNHAMIYDSQNQIVILFGGIGRDYKQNYRDTWIFSSNTSEWEELTISSSKQASVVVLTLLLLFSLLFVPLSFVSFLVFQRKKIMEKRKMTS